MNLEEIGLWRDPETGYYIDVNSRDWNEFNICYNVLYTDLDGRWVLTDGRVGGWAQVDFAVSNYAKHLHGPEAGEVWEITTTDGITSRAVVERVYYGGGEYVSQFIGIYGRYTQSDVTSKRLLITAEGEYVG